jgi:hypothetical protein
MVVDMFDPESQKTAEQIVATSGRNACSELTIQNSINRRS